MIDMGFEESLLKVLDAMPSTNWKSENEEEAEKQEKDTHQTYRTTIMFSATMPPPVERIAKKWVFHIDTLIYTLILTENR